MTNIISRTNSLVRACVCAFACIIPAIFCFATDANAETGDFELGLSAGYNYAMALNPVDGNDTPKSLVNGHGFAVTISPGARVSKYIGIYADFGLNLSIVDDKKHKITNHTYDLDRSDYMYSFNVLLMLRFFQPVYNGEIFEAIGLGYDYAGDSFGIEQPGSGFVTKVSLGYLIKLTNNFKLGIECDVLSNHKFERDYFNFDVDGQIVTVYNF